MSNMNLSSQDAARNLAAKEAILSRLAESKAYNQTIPNPTPHYTSALSLESQDLLESFKIHHANNRGIIIESSEQDLSSALQEILQENTQEDKKVLYNADIAADVSALSGFEMIAYTQSVDSMRTKLFSISTSIVQARCGVADIGVLGLSSNENAPRLSSLITNTCIYLLPKTAIVPHLFGGIEFIKKYEKARSGSNVLPTNIIFVAGPSRTADIELQTVFGVHGPRKTYVVLY